MTMRPNMQAFRLASPTIRRRLMVLLNRWIGSMIAHRERDAARFTQRHLDDRELQDIGIHRSQTTSRQSRGRGDPGVADLHPRRDAGPLGGQDSYGRLSRTKPLKSRWIFQRREAHAPRYCVMIYVRYTLGMDAQHPVRRPFTD